MSYLETPDGSPRKTHISRRVRSVHDVLSPQSKVDALLLLTPTTSYKINKERDERKSEAKIRRFVICLILMHLFTGMLLFSVKTYATTIERRYGLSASMIGLIVAGSDIGHLISLIPSALAASRFSRPVLISFGGMLMALGGAMCCFPHFLCGLYVPLTHQMTNTSESLLGRDRLTLYSPEMCFKRNAISPNPRYKDEFNNQSSYDHFKALFGNSSLYGGLQGSGKDELTLPKMLCTKSEIEIIFLISTLFMGFGAGPVVTLHFSYIDDFTSPSKSPLYIAAVQTCSIIGVILSYAVAGFSSNLYVDIGRVNVGTTVLQPGDVQWVGAWWLGFVIAASGSLIFSLPMMYFDDETEFNDVFDEETNLLQGSKSSGRHVAERGNTKINVAKHHILSPVRRTKYKSVVTDDDVIHPLQHIATNPVVIISLISTVGWHFQPLSSGTFVLKYLQQEFLMSVSTSSLTVGAIIWLPAVLGIPLGGYLYSKLKWNDKQATWFIAILMILASIYYPAGCPATEVVGLTTVTMETGICAASCSCNPDVLNFDPVCGDDSRTYITPCYAGCSKIISKNRTLEPKFDDCMCIGLLEPGDLGATTNSTGAKNGFCSNTCGRYQLPIFVINFVLRVLVLCMTYVPYGVFLMRSVRPTDKAVAIALKEIVGKLFGEIPGSILTGKLFDSCCQFWSKAESGGCQFYDLEVLRVRYFLVNIIPSAVAALSFVLSITFLKSKTRKPELPDIVISPASPATGGSIPTSGPSNFSHSNLP